MSWNINLSGHLDNSGAEADTVEQLAKDFTKLAKVAEVGLTYVSASIPDKGQLSIFSASVGLDRSEEPEDDSDLDEDEEETTEEN